MASESRRNQALCDLFLGDVDKHLLLKTERNPTKMQHGEPVSLSGSLANRSEDFAGAKSRYISEKPHTGWVATSLRCVDGVFPLLTFHRLYATMSREPQDHVVWAERHTAQRTT